MKKPLPASPKGRSKVKRHKIKVENKEVLSFGEDLGEAVTTSKGVAVEKVIKN
jgi:hypothetical protein